MLINQHQNKWIHSLLPCRKAVNPTPLYKAPMPSSFMMVTKACENERYLGVSIGSAKLFLCACNLFHYGFNDVVMIGRGIQSGRTES